MADGRGALPALEQICPTCDGQRILSPVRTANSISGGGTCHTCRGIGTVKTEDGERLLAFLWRHQR